MVSEGEREQGIVGRKGTREGQRERDRQSETETHRERDMRVGELVQIASPPGWCDAGLGLL